MLHCFHLLKYRRRLAASLLGQCYANSLLVWAPHHLQITADSSLSALDLCLTSALHMAQYQTVLPCHNAPNLAACR